jgi:hypothetical protein
LVLLAKDAGQPAARAEEQQPDARGGEAGDLGNFTVRIALGMGQPQKLAFARFHAEERGTQLGLRLTLGGG